MDINQFLSTVWPDAGPYLIAIPVRWTDRDTGEPRKGFRHFPCETVDAAAKQALALAWDVEAPQEVYFALGSIVEVKQKEVRKAPNIAQLKAFWVDLDIGAGEKKPEYPTRSDALLGLKEFCTKAQLPIPYVVSSGGGFHVYWPLTEAIDRHDWVLTASAFKALTRALGLRADPTRTADCASVLRPVGTANWKSGEARRVECIKQGSAISHEEFARIVSFALDAAGIDAPVPQNTLGIAGTSPVANASINAEVVNSLPSTALPSDPKRVVKRCRQLSAQLTSPATVSEPAWYDMVGCIRHCVNGHAAVHKMSARYPGYTANATDEKIAHHEQGGFGPTLCATFEDHNPGGCDGCPHQGKIKSPIVLGHQHERVEAPKAEVLMGAAASTIDMPEPPYPFVRIKNPATGAVQIAIETPGNDGEVDTQVIYENDLYPSGISFDERENRYKARMRRLLPKDGWGEFEFPLGDLFDRRSLARLLGNIGVLPDSSNMDPLVQYMIGYIRQLQNIAAASVVYAQLGWRDSHQYFVLPDRVISDEGERIVTPSTNVDNALGWSKHAPRGTLEAWKKAVATYERPGMEGHQFAFGVGFAAPLLQFTPYAGMIVSVVGASGSGKSTAALCANSIWGHTHMGWADLENDTLRAFYNKLGVLRHLPVTYDEITNMDPAAVSSMCYAVSKGNGRQRLEQTGIATANHGDWQTMMLTTSNSSLHSKLSAAKADTSAEAVRVFEYYIPSGTLTKEDADSNLVFPLEENYGLAGPVYGKGLVDNHIWVRSRVTHWGKEVDRQANITSSERFWSAGVACVMAGFELANQLQLTNVNLSRLMAFAIEAISRMRNTVRENTRTPLSVLTDYLNGNLRNTLILTSMGQQTGVAMPALLPTSELRIRYEVWNKRLYVDRTHFRRYCSDHSVDIQHVKKELLDAGVLLGDNGRVVLGKGTNIKTGQTHVWCINMDHPAMGENSVQLTNTAETQNAAVR